MNGIDSLALQLQKTINEKDKNKKTGYDTQATVVKVEDDTIWVKIPGGVDETPVAKTTSAKPGDTVQVRVSGGRAWVVGNYTSPPTDDTTANTALDIVNALDLRVEAAGTRLTIVEGNITGLEERVVNNENLIVEVENDISELDTRVNSAEGKITEVESDISGLDTRVEQAESNVSGITTRLGTAETKLSAAESEIDALQTDVQDAQVDINNTLQGLALAENVIGTLAWLTAHSTETTDTTPVSGKSYYIRHQDGTFELVQDTAGKNPAEEHWYEMDDAISNYVGAHLSLTEYGLNLTLDNSSYRVHIGTLTSTGDDGVYIIDGEGNVVTFFGDNIRFDSTHAQYIGNNNAYIVFDPTGNNGQGSITIGGSSIRMGSGKTLDQLLAEKAEVTDIPTKVSDLENDEGYLNDLDVSVTQTSTGADITIKGDTVSLTNGEDAVVVNIHSSNGMAFKNDSVDTTMTVTVYYGSTVITNQTALTRAFGAGTYLQWKARLYGDTGYTTIPVNDPRLSNNGFTFVLTPADVNVQAVFVVEVIAP